MPWVVYHSANGSIITQSIMTNTTTSTYPTTFTVGGDLTVNRLGFGAMRVTGKGI